MGFTPSKSHFFWLCCHPEALWVRKSLFPPSISQTRPAGRCKIPLELPGIRGSGMGVQPLPKDLTYMLGLGMDPGKLGSAGSRGKLGSAAFFSRKGDFLKELEFPSCINLLKQRKPRCYRKREDSWRTASAPAGIWGFVSKTTLFLLKTGKGSTPKGFAAGC